MSHVLRYRLFQDGVEHIERCTMLFLDALHGVAYALNEPNEERDREKEKKKENVVLTSTVSMHFFGPVELWKVSDSHCIFVEECLLLHFVLCCVLSGSSKISFV